MSLIPYKKKRNLKESTEPAGGKSDDANKLRFVIQKHDASHLHYDFRLEMEGVLKSWAVPKGPSTDPNVKRLAMMVEDHPYDYRTFEGIIPSGYGAGTVIVWDEGFYEPVLAAGKDKKTMTKELLEGLKKGKIHFVLHGKKLNGEYALIRAFGKDEKSWLLFKIKDAHASNDDITLKDKSVISKKTLEQIEKSFSKSSSKNAKKKTPNKKEIKVNKAPGFKETSINEKKKENNSKKDDQILEQAPKGKFQTKIKPMLATLVDSPFDKEGWLYEIKWDGYRALAFMNNGQVTLKSRNDKSFDEKFYPILTGLKKWNINAIVDGEIVVIDDKGNSNFGDLQNWRSEADGELYYYVFDILWYDGKSLLDLPLKERRAILEEHLPSESHIRLSQSFNESGIDFFESAKKMGLEGIIAKKADSSYTPGNRSKDWLKIKANKRQEMVIGGYTKNDETSKQFSALLVGVFEGDELRYTGKVGTGFNDKQQKEMLAKFKKYIIKSPPFTEIPDINKPSRFRPNPPHATATWLKPELVCEVSYREMTKDGIMRHPSFEGMRIDKNAKEVVREKAKKTSKTIKEANLLKDKKMISPSKQGRKTLLNPTDETQVRNINGHELKFTHLSKLYWPKEKISKCDLLNYYYQAAPYILPYLKDRPQSMLRHPDGINGESFFFKDITGKSPEWLETFLYHSPADDRDRNYLVAKDEASLLYMVQLGCIELNPWHSRVQTEDYPDWCIIDLDPGKKTTFNQVIEAAQVIKEILDGFGIPGYPKTSGSRGIHIYIPLGAKYTYEQSKEFARVIARLVSEKLPKFTTIERTVKERDGKMYIDFLQNRPQATVSAPYSVRPKPGATVSMPLHWDEVKKGLKMSDFTIFNAIDRIKSEGDIFKPVLGKGINLQKAIKNFESHL